MFARRHLCVSLQGPVVFLLSTPLSTHEPTMANAAVYIQILHCDAGRVMVCVGWSLPHVCWGIVQASTIPWKRGRQNFVRPDTQAAEPSAGAEGEDKKVRKKKKQPSSQKDKPQRTQDRMEPQSPVRAGAWEVSEAAAGTRQ